MNKCSFCGWETTDLTVHEDLYDDNGNKLELCELCEKTISKGLIANEAGHVNEVEVVRSMARMIHYFLRRLSFE
jgi:hypothetical protein